MKRIKNKIYSGAAAFILLSLTFVSCVDKNDWETDSSYDRLFSVSKLSVSVDKTEAEVTWTVTPGTEYYILEVSKDSLYDDIAMNASNSSIVFGEDKSITKSPYTITGLEGSTRYYFRIKGYSEIKQSSNWAYLEKLYFETKGEQILVAVDPEEKTENSVILRWDAGGAWVSHIILTYTKDGDSQEIRVDLNDTDRTNSYVYIDELQEATTYTAVIYNNDNKRGEISFRTNESIPQEGVVLTLDGTEDIVAYLEATTASELTLILPVGSLFESAWINESAEPQTTLRIPEHITSLTFWGAEGGSQAVINTTSVKTGAALSTLNFKNVELRGKSSSSDYVMNENATSNLTNISFDGCTINTFRGVFRMQNESNMTYLSTISFKDCIVHTIGGYGLINIVKTVTLGDITIEDCTFYKMEVFVIVTSKPNVITTSNCTFYNTITNNKYYFSMGEGNVPDNFSINNCIFGKNHDGTARATSPANKTTTYVFNSYITNDCDVVSGYPLTGIEDYNGSSSDLFTDPDNADFSIKDSSFAGKDSAGDPRWR